MPVTRTLDLSPDIARALEEKAQQNGLSVAEFATALLAQVARITQESSSDQLAEVAARLTALQRIGAYDTGARAGLPPLSDEAVSREGIYESRGR
jgi:hypothetical protein